MTVNTILYPPLIKSELEEIMFHLPDTSMTKKRLQGMIDGWRYAGKW